MLTCGFCKTVCVDYETLQKHKAKRCRVLLAIRARQERERLFDEAVRALPASGDPRYGLAETQRRLIEWGVPPPLGEDA